jgi:hypothetical protein
VIIHRIFFRDLLTSVFIAGISYGKPQAPGTTSCFPKSVWDAKALIIAAGLNPDLTYEFGGTENQISSQSPKAGHRSFRGSMVGLIVMSGPTIVNPPPSGPHPRPTDILAGTIIQAGIPLAVRISSDALVNSSNQSMTFSATMTKSVFSGGSLISVQGSKATGTLVLSDEQIGGKPAIRLTHILLSTGRSLTIRTDSISVDSLESQSLFIEYNNRALIKDLLLNRFPNKVPSGIQCVFTLQEPTIIK